jgi:hypothetical protein
MYTSMEALDQSVSQDGFRYHPQPSQSNPNVVFRRPAQFGLLY